MTTDHRNLKKTPRRNEGCGDSSLRRRSSCFTSKAIKRLSKRPNIARVSISKDGWVVNTHISCPLLELAFSTHFNITRPRSRMRANIPDVPHRDVASRPGGGEENNIEPVRRQAPRTERPLGQRGVGRDQLAVLGLLDPERGKPQARYGLAQLSPEETLGALAFEGLCADNLRSITHLAPWESLAAFGLIDGGEIA